MSLLEAFGVRVREVPDLDEGAVWVESRSLLLLDAELSDDRREAVVCRMLGRVAGPT